MRGKQPGTTGSAGAARADETYMDGHPDRPLVSTPRRIDWIVAPPRLCVLCREPLTQPSEVSAWNGSPAHRDCVRIHLIQRDPAFREPESEEAPEESSDSLDGALPRDDEDPDLG